MSTVAAILVVLVALLHVVFVILEMFLWTTPTGRRVFGLDPEFAQASRVLAANQGLYNGFLAAGLLWALVADDFGAQVFFLVCVLVAGAFGAYTVNARILLVQAVPAFVALGAVLFAG